MPNHKVSLYNDISKIREHLDRIATALEAAGKRASAKTLNQVLDQGVGDADLAVYWQADVVRGDTVLGYTDWLVWHKADQEEKKENNA